MIYTSVKSCNLYYDDGIARRRLLHAKTRI